MIHTAKDTVAAGIAPEGSGEGADTQSWLGRKWGMDLGRAGEEDRGPNSVIKHVYETLEEVIQKKKCRPCVGSHGIIISNKTMSHGQRLLKASTRGQVAASFIVDTSGWKLLNSHMGRGLLMGKHNQSSSKERKHQSPKENLIQPVPRIYHEGTGNAGGREMF